MNREIKFRAWHSGLKKMFSHEEMGQDQLTLMPDGRGFINVSGSDTRFSQFIPDMIPMQYIGQKDKNGKEIYEGDIKRDEIETDNGDDRLWYICVYIQDWTRFAWLNLPGEYDEYLESGIEHLDHSLQETFGVFADETDCTIVCGNMFENPELLKEETIPERYFKDKKALS